MPTLLSLKTEGMKRAHTCDARCYNAKGTTCRCFCNGANHGKGYDFAVDNIVRNKEVYESLGCRLSRAITQAVAMLKGETP